MKFILGPHVFLLSISLLDGLAGLRLIKVSIPPYKFRGESAILECQYELNRTDGPPYYGGVGSSSGREFSFGGGNNRHHSYTQSRTRTRTHTHARNRNMQFFDAHHLVEMRPKYKRNKRQYSYQSGRLQTQQQVQQQQQQHQQYQQHYQTYQYEPTHLNSGDSYYQQHEHQQQQAQLQQQKEVEEHHYPYQTQRSPYGHSVYRGAAFSRALGIPGFSDSGVVSSSSRGTHVSASTYANSGPSRGALAEISARRHTFDEGTNSDDEEDNEEEEADGEEEEEEDEEDEGESLYAIKWYKDNEEFYRFVPKARQQKTSYRFDGLRVSEERSDSWRVFLRGLAINSSGLYRCEISAEAPNFSSVQGEGHMDVVYLPIGGPHIRGQQAQYQNGDTLSLNCTSGKSHPVSRLQWLINDQPVLDDSYLITYNDTVHKHGLITSMLGLELKVDGRHFQDGAMRVKCLASISPMLWSGDKESVLQRRRGIIDKREAMLLVRGSAIRLHPLGKFPSSLYFFVSIAVLRIPCQLLMDTKLT